MGPPGAGKGTQGALLAEWLAIPRYATGDILRAARRADTPLGRQARRYMDAGELVPDAVVLDLVVEVLDGDEAENGYVLDGFPRTVTQARGLADLLAARGEQLDAVIYLEVPDEELQRRMAGRAAVEDRADDTPETIRHRLGVYRQATEPVLRWYRESDVSVIDVVGVGTVADIQAEIRSRLAM